MRGRCKIADDGYHDPAIEGNPRSEMTYYVCTICGERQKRGQGAFYGQPNHNPPTIEQRVVELEKQLSKFLGT